MQITEYSFGRIVIDGETFTSDVIIYPDRVDASWWRKQGHLLQPEDLAEAVEASPEDLVVGTGHAGVMRIAGETRDFLEAKGIRLHAHPTGDAVSLFQRIQGERRVIAALHLTC